LISAGWEDRFDIGQIREFLSGKNRVIPNESADPEQYDRDKRIAAATSSYELNRELEVRQIGSARRYPIRGEKSN
jgi:hypothetical protein